MNKKSNDRPVQIDYFKGNFRFQLCALCEKLCVLCDKTRKSTCQKSHQTSDPPSITIPPSSKTSGRHPQDKSGEPLTFLLHFTRISSAAFREFFGKSTPFLAQFFGSCSGKPPICSGTLRESFGKRAFSSGILRQRSNTSARAPKGMRVMGGSWGEAVCLLSFFSLVSG